MVSPSLFFFNYFWLHWVFIATQAFSSCSKQGLLFVAAQVSHCSGFSCCRAWALGHTVVEAHGLNCSAACGIFLDWGLAGIFLTTAPPGKSLSKSLIRYFFLFSLGIVEFWRLSLLSRTCCLPIGKHARVKEKEREHERRKRHREEQDKARREWERQKRRELAREHSRRER